VGQAFEGLGKLFDESLAVNLGQVFGYSDALDGHA
jgi:hypothetical protein